MAGLADKTLGLITREVTVSQDEGLREGTTAQGISSIKPAIAGGVVAAEYVVRAAPDGHTLLCNSSQYVVGVSLYKDPGYDAFRDFAPIINAGTSPNIIFVHPTTQANNLKELIALARASGIEPILATEVTGRPPFRTWSESFANLVGTALGRRAYRDGVNDHVATMNRWLVDTAAREGLLLLDFQAVLAEPSGRRHKPFSQPDGSHTTTAGYAALTAYAVPLLDQHFREH